MRKVFSAVFILLLYVVSAPAMVASLEKNDDKFMQAVKELESFFPVVTGYVVSVAEDSIYIDIAAGDGIRPGSELHVYHEGDAIVHPLTRQVLGHQEISLGIIRVDQVRDVYSIGRIIVNSGYGEIAPGDFVRISSRRLKTGVLSRAFSEKPENPLLSLQNELFIAMEKSSRFYPSGMEDSSSISAPFSPEHLKELAEEDGLDLIIHINWEGPPHNHRLNLTSFSGKTGLRVNRTCIEVDSPMNKTEAKSPHADSRAPADRWAEFALGHKTASLCHGWLTGAPEGELSITDGTSLFVYSRRNSAFDLLWEDKGNSSYQILSIDCGDINGNGLDEIFVTGIRKGVVSSYVLEFQDEEFIKKDASEKYIYRIIKSAGKSARLFAREMVPTDLFQKPVIELLWKEGRYVPNDHDRPGIPDIFGFDLADINGDGIQEIIILNNNERIDIYHPSGKRIWTSMDSFGGSSRFIDSEQLEEDGISDNPGGLVIKGRILSVDIDNDNRHELVLFRNIPKLGNFLKNLRIYDRSHIGVYHWDGSDMILSSKLHELSGYLSDCAVAEYPDGTAELIIGLDETSLPASTETGKILIRTLNNKSSEL